MFDGTLFKLFKNPDIKNGYQNLNKFLDTYVFKLLDLPIQQNHHS